MVPNLAVSCNSSYNLNKRNVHKIVRQIKSRLLFSIDSVIINFISSKEIIPINSVYLGHNFSTDIITFNYSGENDTLDGEIFISLEDARYNAEKFNVSMDDELLRLIVHGFLHLLGFDDKLKADKKIMKMEEDKLVAELVNSKIKIMLNYDC